MTIFKSRAFWTALVDALIGVAFLLLRLYWPGQVAVVLEVWKYFQPVVALLIAAFTVDDAAKLWAGVRYAQLAQQADYLEGKK